MRQSSVNRPLVFAHRGASKAAPENTLPAFQTALDMGADGVELDVQYTADRRLIVLHNPDLDATTDGHGPASALPLSEIQALDAGSWFAPQFAHTCIPTLDEVLDLLAGRCLVNIEIKSVDLRTKAIAVDTVAAVRRHQMADQVVISSFNPFAVRSARLAGREIEAGLLLAPDLPGWMRWDFVRRISLAQGLHPESRMVDPSYLARARRLGMPVRVWTVDDLDEMRRMIRLGVDAIITDVPDVVLKVLA